MDPMTRQRKGVLRHANCRQPQDCQNHRWRGMGTLLHNPTLPHLIPKGSLCMKTGVAHGKIQRGVLGPGDQVAPQEHRVAWLHHGRKLLVAYRYHCAGGVLRHRARRKRYLRAARRNPKL